MSVPAPQAPEAIVFDLGGVLVDWNPRHLYRKLFDLESEMETFLATVCTDAWNICQDAGRSVREGTEALVAEHPDHETLIRAYYGRWEEMVPHPVNGAVALLESLRNAGIPLYLLSNCASETFDVARGKYPFLDWFEDWVVSARVGAMKPDPAIYRIAAARAGRPPESLLFVDDRPENVAGARACGWSGHHFVSTEDLRADLIDKGVLPD